MTPELEQELEQFWTLTDKALLTVMRRDGKNAMEQLAKLTEEVGELAQAMLCVHGAKSNRFRHLTVDNIKEELADILLCVRSIALTHGLSTSELENYSGAKLHRWNEKLEMQERIDLEHFSLEEAAKMHLAKNRRP